MKSFLLSLICLLSAGALPAQVVFQGYGVAPENQANEFGQIASYKNMLLFSGDDGNHPRQLWSCDGTVKGTQMVVHPPATTPSGVYDWVDYNGKMIFSGRDTGGTQPWITDGSSQGTYPLKYIPPDLIHGSYPDLFTVFNNQVFFITRSINDTIRRLWHTDGTKAGTQPFGEIRTGHDMILYNNKLFFVGYDDAHGFELWTSDGIEANTKLFMDINPGKNDIVYRGIYPMNFIEYNGKLYFNADDGVHGSELWVTDGTAQGTHMVTDFHPGKTWTNIKAPIVYNGKIYFESDTGQIYVKSCLVTSDGTEAGTQLFVPAANTWPAVPVFIYKDMLYLCNGPDLPPAFFRTDGTTAGTVQVKDARGIEVQSAIMPMGVSNTMFPLWPHYPGSAATWASQPVFPINEYAGRLYFAARVDASTVLIQSDGTNQGTVEIAPPGLDPYFFLSYTAFAKHKDRLYFGGQFGTNPYQLWSVYDSAGLAGVEKITAQDICTLFPNPSHGVVNISFKSTQRNIDINLTDLNGRIIQRSHFTASANIQLDVRAMNTGIYFINVIADDKKQSLKFIKE